MVSIIYPPLFFTFVHMLSPHTLRADFPLLLHHGEQLVYLDNAATTQKPQQVIEALEQYYTRYNANIHRSVFTIAQEATQAYEAARTEVQQFLGAERKEEIVFVRGGTEGINLVAERFLAPRLKSGDNVVISAMEHHANLVPWQALCKRMGATLRVIPMNHQGKLELNTLPHLLNQRTRMLALVHTSNSLGTVNPIEEIIPQAQERDIPVLIDGAQSAAHQPINVETLGCDFFVCSGHKLMGPTGIGVLYGKAEHLETMEPYQYGGEMIRSVSFEQTVYNHIPHKFEAGTPHIAGAIGLGAAIQYLRSIGMEQIHAYTQELLEYATNQLSGIEDLTIIGNAPDKAGIISFTLGDIHPHDIGTILNEEGIAIRAGHHCTQPTMEYFGIPGTARASFTFYNTREEIDRLATALRQVQQMFS